MWDTAQRFLPGHRIALQIAGAAHPKFAVNLGTAGGQAVQTEGVIARHTLYHDAARPSRLLLTVLPAG
jgi:predicted acyl esterase